jgi:hypothetical protein
MPTAVSLTRNGPSGAADALKLRIRGIADMARLATGLIPSRMTHMCHSSVVFVVMHNGVLTPMW